MVDAYFQSRAARRWAGAGRLALMVLPLCLAVPPARAQDDFQFSWEKTAEGGPDTKGKAADNREAGADEAAPTEKAAFKWTGETEGGGTETAEAEPAPAAAAPDRDYQEMVKENAELKRKIAEASRIEETVRKENESLSAGLKDMERRNNQFAALIRDLQEQKKESAGDPEELKALEIRLDAAEQEKAKLSGELAQLRKTIAAQAKAGESAGADVPPAVPAPAAASPSAIKPGSDLYRDKEKENLTLRNKLVDIEIARRNAVKERDDLVAKAEKAEAEARQAEQQQKAMQAKLEAAAAAQKENARTIEKLMTQIPALETELAALKGKAAKQGERSRDIESMEVELQKREQRLATAERMTAILEKARADVVRVSERERRDMHYNMAVVYAKEGRVREAEAEYLRALQIDPNDAAAHYNLGILYDDELNDKNKAAMHYRKYLKLNPYGSDVDAVKSWLLKIEMAQ